MGVVNASGAQRRVMDPHRVLLCTDEAELTRILAEVGLTTIDFNNTGLENNNYQNYIPCPVNPNILSKSLFTLEVVCATLSSGETTKRCTPCKDVQDVSEIFNTRHTFKMLGQAW